MGNQASSSGGAGSQTLRDSLAASERLCWIELGEQPDSLPPARNSQGSCSHDGRLFIYGGRSPEGRLNDLWQLDCETRTWTCLCENDAPGNPMVRSGSLLVHDERNCLYVGFGYDKFPVAHSEMYRFDLSTRVWSEALVPAGGISPPPRINFRSWFYDDCVWIFGGSPDGTVCYGDLWKFNTVINVWTQLKPTGDAPPACQWCTCEVWKGPFVVFFGGHLADGSPSETFHVLDMEKLSWSNLMQQSEPLYRQLKRRELPSMEEDEEPPTWPSLLCSSPASVMYGENVLILWGGWDGKEHRTDMWAVDLSTLEWNRIRPRTANSLSEPSAKCSASAVIHNGTVYLFGGWNGWQQTNDLHAVSFAFPTLQRYCLQYIAANSDRFADKAHIVEMLAK